MSHKLFIYIHVLYRCLVSKEALKDFQDISLENGNVLKKMFVLQRSNQCKSKVKRFIHQLFRMKLKAKVDSMGEMEIFDLCLL